MLYAGWPTLAAFLESKMPKKVLQEVNDSLTPGKLPNEYEFITKLYI